MQQLIELTQKIEDRELRKKVVEYIKNPSLSHKDFKKYPREDWKKAKTLFSVGNVAVERDVLKHTITVTELSIKTAEILEKNLGLKIDKDCLIAGAIVHDVTKLFEWKISKGSPEHTGVLLDHSFLGVAELYTRGFPEQVIHIVASHFGETGPTPPRSFEALIFHHIDTMISLTEYYHQGMSKQKVTELVKQQIPLILLDEETIKQLSGEKAERK